MKTLKNFEELNDFFATYFHEDFVCETHDPDQVISTYLAYGWSSEELRNLAEQIMRFMEEFTDDVKLENAIFTELGCYYLPSADNISARSWLQHVASTLLAAANKN